MKKFGLIAIILLLLLSSCTKEEIDTSENINNSINPDFILQNAKYTLGQEGEDPLYLEAKELIIYEMDDLVYASELSFYQLDTDGNISLTGTAGYAIIDTNSKSTEFSKGVELNVINENMQIISETLNFDTEKQNFESRDDIYAKKDNITISAKGVFGNLVTNEFEFENIEKGEIVL